MKHNTKEEAAKMEKGYGILKDSIEEDNSNPGGKAGTPRGGKMEAIWINIEWWKKYDKKGNKEDYDLSKMKDPVSQQAAAYRQKGVLNEEEASLAAWPQTWGLSRVWENKMAYNTSVPWWKFLTQGSLEHAEFTIINLLEVVKT